MPFYIEIDNNETFETVTKNSAVCVVDFYTSWCGPCKALAPKLEKTITDHPMLSTLHTSNLNKLDQTVTFVKVDVDKHPELAEEFKVSSIPFICFYKNGILCEEKVIGANLDGIMNTVTKLTTDLVEKHHKNNENLNIKSKPE